MLPATATLGGPFTGCPRAMRAGVDARNGRAKDVSESRLFEGSGGGFGAVLSVVPAFHLLADAFMVWMLGVGVGL